MERHTGPTHVCIPAGEGEKLRLLAGWMGDKDDDDAINMQQGSGGGRGGGAQRGAASLLTTTKVSK